MDYYMGQEKSWFYIFFKKKLFLVAMITFYLWIAWLKYDALNIIFNSLF